MNRSLLIVLLYLSTFPSDILAQNSWGLETSAFHAGFNIGFTANSTITEKFHLNYKLQYQYTDRDKISLNDFEKGSGIGGVIGIEFKNSLINNLSIGSNFGLWYASLEWNDYSSIVLDNNPSVVSGNLGNDECEICVGKSSKIMLNPQINLSYSINFENNFILKPYLAYSIERNLYEKDIQLSELEHFLFGIQFLTHF